MKKFQVLKEDAQIWERFKSGDKSAVSDIYFGYFHSMFQYGIKFRNDPEFIKDCIQDVFIKLISAGRNLGPTDNIRYYLFKALKHNIYKNLAKTKDQEFAERSVPLFGMTFSLEDEIIEKETITNTEKVIAGALSNLNSRQREIIYLRYECGMEYGQISSIMQLNPDSARKLVYRAVRLLKEAMRGERNNYLLFFLLSPVKHVIQHNNSCLQKSGSRT